MKQNIKPTIFTVVLAILFFSQQASALITQASFKEDHVPNQLLIKLKSNTSSLASSFLLSSGAEKLKSFKDSNLSLYKFPDTTDMQKFSLNLQDLSDIEYVELNYYHYLQATPNDSSYSKVYGLNNRGQSGGSHDADIDAPEAWEITKGSSKVLIGIIDTGVDYTHPDLVDNYWTNPGESGKDSRGRDKRTNGIDDDKNGYVDDYRGWNFYDKNNDPQDGHSHGTHCAGIIGARGNNKKGIVGVNWYASIVGLKIFSDAGKTRSDAIISAIEYASDMRIPITNNSWGSYNYSTAIKSAISRATRKGMLFVAAAGNYRTDSNDKPFYPASYKISGVVSVAATDHRDRLASFSNFGSKSVDVAAPGNRIYSTVQRGRYAYKNGTSMAAPYVTGVAALLKAKNSRISASKMKAAIVNSGDSIPSLQGVVQSGRRVNAYKALKY